MKKRSSQPQPIKALFPATVRQIMVAHAGATQPSLLPRVYLAGKIRTGDWRFDAVTGLRDAWSDGDGQKPWPVLPGAVLDGRAESPRQVVAEMARAAAAFIPKPTQAGDDQ